MPAHKRKEKISPLHSGSRTVQTEENRIMIPEPVFQNHLLKKGRHVHWGIRFDFYYLVVTRDEDYFHESRNYGFVGSTSVGEEMGVATIPRTLFPEKIGRDYVDYDMELHFVTTDKMKDCSSAVCWVLTDQQWRKLRKKRELPEKDSNPRTGSSNKGKGVAADAE